MSAPPLTLPLAADDWIVVLAPLDDVVIAGTRRGRLFIVTDDGAHLQAVEVPRADPAR